jgi:hypothetical protein
MATPQPVIPALTQILSATCGLNAGHPQFNPPPLSLITLLDNNRKRINETQIKKGGLSFDTLYDLSGNPIVLDK